MGLEIIIGIGIIAFLFLYFFLNLKSDPETGENTHYFLKLILFFFFIMSLILLGKSISDNGENCQMQVTNITTNGAVQSYNYQQVCLNATVQTARTTYKLTTWFTRLAAIYFFLFLLYYWWSDGFFFVRATK